MKYGKIIKISACIIATIVLLLLGITMARNSAGEKVWAASASWETSYEKTYQEYLNANGFDGTLATSVIDVELDDYQTSDDMEAYAGEMGIVTEDSGSITWSFLVEESGFYNLQLGYIPLTGTTSDIQRKIYIDGEIPHDALSQVVISRYWTDEQIKIKSENEIRPESYEVYAEIKWFIEDYQRRNNEPLMFYFEAGTHTITFEVIKEAVEYTSLIFQACGTSPAYEDRVGELKQEHKIYDGEILTGQAERRDGITTDIIKSLFRRTIPTAIWCPITLIILCTIP